jgi:hypothetical protein
MRQVNFRALRLRLAFVWACLLSLLLAAESFGLQFRLRQLRGQLSQELTNSIAGRAVLLSKQLGVESVRDAQAERQLRSSLTNQAWLSGSLAREHHQTEWNLRLTHDPSLATTLLESNLVTMEKLGQDATLAAQSALEKVASLSAPRGSRVEVAPEGDGFRVRVAFMMSSLSQHESGAVTKHHSTDEMRTEIRELSARVLRDLYDYCGSRGIKSISVTCNHTLRETVVPDNATAEEREQLRARAQPVPARLYRVSLDQSHANAIADWRRAALSKVSRLYAVEYDGLKTLTITIVHDQFLEEDQHDAAGQLEF